MDTATALKWLKESGNPNGRPNSDVVRPIYNGSDITRRWAGNWVVDFAGMELTTAAYGWEDYTPDMSDGDILHRLPALNLERSKTMDADYGTIHEPG